MENAFVWNLDPTIFRIGSLQIRYYGLIFATMIYLGYLMWRHQMLRGGYSKELTERFFLWGVIAVVAGARLGHCLFYHTDRYLSDPISILYVWKGGLASHGATAGLLIALILFAWKNKLNIIEILDRFSMSAAIGAAMVRLANFLNSEIVGRATDVPWAVKFIRYDGGKFARHPSQIYEFALGAFIFFTLFFVDRWTGKEKRPLGLLAGIFLSMYFLGRFLVEFVKEYHIRNSGLTQGQYLSMLPFLAGIGLLIWVFTKRRK